MCKQVGEYIWYNYYVKSKKDKYAMKDLNKISIEDLGKGSKIKLEPCDVEHDMYWRVAIDVLETIQKNNEQGQPTVMVVPYGPLGPYSRLVYLINKYRVSLKNCVFINMDEYLTDDKKYIDNLDPLSFRGGMDRIFYSKIDEELNIPSENRYFPDPENPEKVMEIIKKYGKLDLVFGGVGINGHYAFNEPPKDNEDCSNLEFMNRPTRVLEVSLETRTVNAVMNCGGDIDQIPKYCITVGMKEIFMAKKIIMCQPRDWNAGALRKILHGEPTSKVPCSLFQNHNNAVLYATTVAMQPTKPEIRVYNK